MKPTPLKKKAQVSRTISDEHLQKYLALTTKALALVKKAPTPKPLQAQIIIDMVERYVSDASYFMQQGDIVRAFAAVNYAHGWLDTGATLGIFQVTDSTLFTVDDPEDK
jgi:hypothetical protein